MGREIRRGDVYYVDLEPIKGSEQGGNRPALVISNNIGNHYGPTVIIAIITSQDKPSHMPTHVVIQSNCLSLPSTVVLEQIRTIDKCRIGEYIGCLSHFDMRHVDHALGVSIGLNEQSKRKLKASVS